MNRRIVVLGNPDEFVLGMVARIAALPGAQCVYGVPTLEGDVDAVAIPGDELPYFTIAFDPDDAASIQQLIRAAFAVVNLYDVYPGADRLLVPAQCAALGVHYVDIADSREYVAAFTRLAREAAAHDALLVTRAGAVPVVVAMLSDILAAEFDSVSEIHVSLTPGIDDRCRTNTLQSCIERLLRLTRAKHGGRWRPQHWWEGVEVLRFPAPIGLQRGYACDLPCLEDLSKYYNARTIDARTVVGRGMLNALLRSLALLLRGGIIKQQRATAALLRFMASVRCNPTDTASIRVAMHGRRGRTEDRYVASLMARNGAARAVSTSPVVALVRQWITNGVKEAGAMPCIGLLRMRDLTPELRGHDVVLVRE